MWRLLKRRAARCGAERSFDCWRSHRSPQPRPPGVVSVLLTRSPSRQAHLRQVRQDIPALKVVSSYAPAKTPGMPGPYPGRVVSVKSDKSVDVATGQANDTVVREMMASGMRALTGAGTTPDAWRRFFVPADVVGIKVNCGGFPHCVSAYEIVAEIVRQLIGIGVPVSQIYLYERFQSQLDEVQLRAASAVAGWRSSRPSAPTATSTTAATIRRPTSKPTSSAKKTRAPA